MKKFYIKKTSRHGDFYLSPGGRRWINVLSTKHRFGKFSLEVASDFVERNNENAKHGDTFSVVSVD